MILAIKDPGTLHRVHPAQVGAYLLAKGWQRRRHEPNRFSLWTKAVGEENHEVLLPLDSRLGDFVERMAELLADLQREEMRSQLEILRDVEAGTCDVFRFRKSVHPVYAGTIPIEDGVRFVSSVRDLLLDSASAEHGLSRLSTAGRRPDAVAQFMNDALLGQTEVSSFVVTAQIPIPARLNDELFPEALTPASEPFERRAGVRLMTSLQETRAAALEVAQTNDVRAFKEVLARGLSPRFFKAIIEAQGAAAGEALSVSSSWASSRPLLGPGRVDEVTFEPEMVLPLRAAVERLQALAPREGETIYGFVELLEQPAQERLIGELAIKSTVDGRARKVRLRLPQPEYGEAIQAFGEKRPVKVTGDLVKDGKFWLLHNPRDLVVFPSAESAAEEDEPASAGSARQPFTVP